MKSLADPTNALARGLTEIRQQFKIPGAFPAGVLAAAELAVRRTPTEHADRTALAFVTLDPQGSTDLDQAFFIESSGSDLLLHYAIADVAWFVDDGDAIDTEAWKRGETFYLPDGRAPLHPPVLSEGAASLLPDGVRPAVIFTVRLSPDGSVKLDGVERALVRNRAKLAYETVRDSDLPEGFSAFAERMMRDEARRGASRVDPPEQQVQRLAKGAFQLVFRPKLKSEAQNATLSLAANMAIADALFAHKTGLFRVMSEPDDRATALLRNAAKALGLAWPDNMALRDYQKGLDPTDPSQAAFMLEIRKASPGASYMPYKEGVVPWHGAMAATYAHATVPLRRLADRYVIRAALAIANGQAAPDVVSEAFQRLPKVMARADGRAAQVNAAVLNLAEAVMLRGREGESFAAVVTDVNGSGARIQLCSLPVVAYLGDSLRPGARLRVKLVSADPDQRKISFEQAG